MSDFGESCRNGSIATHTPSLISLADLDHGPLPTVSTLLLKKPAWRQLAGSCR